MFDHINVHASVAVYTQIENLVRFAIAGGRLKSEDRLPSIYELSRQLDVTVNTVVKAYRDLEVMGLVHCRRGRGVYVRNGADVKCRTAVRREIVARIYEAVSEAKSSGMSAKDVLECVERLYERVGEPYAVDDALVRELAKKR